MGNFRTKVFLPLAAVIVGGLSFGAIALYQTSIDPAPRGTVLADSQRSQEQFRARCEIAIAKAELAARNAVALRAKQFHDFIAHRQYRTVDGGRIAVAAFADSVLSLGSKGRLIWSKLPFTDRDGYKKHVSRMFSVCLFTPEELAAELKRAVDDSMKDVAAIENQLAAELQEVITGASTPEGLGGMAPDQFKHTMERIVATGNWEMTKDIGNLAVSEIASNVGVQVLVKLGVSSGILTAGSVSAWWTFGAGAVIGILVDATWNWIDDPEADIQRDVLRETSRLAVDGMNALNAEFSRVIERRRDLWRLSANEWVR